MGIRSAVGGIRRYQVGTEGSDPPEVSPAGIYLVALGNIRSLGES